MSGAFDNKDLERRMDGAISAFKKELSGLRSGRASASLLEPVMVEAYGSPTPISQVGSVSVPEPRMLTVQVWDAGLTAAVEKAIRESNLGLNPASDGNNVRVRLPELNKERREQLVKVARDYAEQGRVAVRHVRRDGMDSLKKMEKDGDISKDDLHNFSDQVQKSTDAKIKEIDALLESKETEIMQV